MGFGLCPSLLFLLFFYIELALIFWDFIKNNNNNTENIIYTYV